MIDVEFKYMLKSNFNVQIRGTVEVPDNEDAEDHEYEITFETQSGTSQRVFVNHYGVELTPTDEQNWECDRLKDLFESDDLFLIRICENAESNVTIDLGEVELDINDGAKMECEFISAEAEYGRYYATLVFRFNDARIELDDDLKQALVDEIDYIYGDCGTTFISPYGKIVAEISKNHYGIFTDDKYYIKETEDVTEDILDSARMILAQQYTRNLGIYSKFGDMMEQSMDDCHDDADLFWLSELDEEHIYEELSRAGYFDEEQQDSEYVCVQSDIDGKFRVMKGEDAPYGTCYSVAGTYDDAVVDGANFLGIDPQSIGMW